MQPEKLAAVTSAGETAEEARYRNLVAALISTLGRKKGTRLLREITERAAQEATLSDAFPIRQTSAQAGTRAARQQAAAQLERYMPLWVASLPRG